MPDYPLQQLGDTDVDKFLQHYWQQQPLLIRQAIPHFSSLISPDELAGLALEADVESRLVREQTTDGLWQVEYGPLSESTLTSLPNSGWSLLIQGVDRLLPSFAHLLKQFRFLPTWRLDDIMVSLAPEGGSVGPHFDYYDVFLLQAHGQRRWQLGEFCSEQTPRVSNTDLRILANFKAREEWLLNPGDMLYLPAKIAHWGIAVGESMTYSIGFRAPRLSEIISEYCDSYLEQLGEDPYFRDPPRTPNLASAQITDADVDTVRSMLNVLLQDREQIVRWFGHYVTRAVDDNIVDEFATSESELDPATRYQFEIGVRRAYYCLGDFSLLFINGMAFNCSTPLARALK